MADTNNTETKHTASDIKDKKIETKQAVSDVKKEKHVKTEMYCHFGYNCKNVSINPQTGLITNVKCNKFHCGAPTLDHKGECRHKNKCIREKCQFRHPRLCRYTFYGKTCPNKDKCEFSHTKHAADFWLENHTCKYGEECSHMKARQECKFFHPEKVYEKFKDKTEENWRAPTVNSSKGEPSSSPCHVKDCWGIKCDHSHSNIGKTYTEEDVRKIREELTERTAKMLTILMQQKV